MKSTLQTLALATFCGLSALTLSSCGGSDSSSSSSSSSVSTLDSLGGYQLSDMVHETPDIDEACVSTIMFNETGSTAYVALQYTVKEFDDKPAITGTIIDEAATCVYNPATGIVVLTIADPGNPSSTLTMTLIKKDDTTLTVQSGATLLFNYTGETPYSVINTEFQYDVIDW